VSQQQIDIIQLQHDVALSRDQQAYKMLFKYFHKPLIRFGTSIVKSKEAAEEIYSDIMLKMWDLGNALNNIDNLKTYLFISVKNASLNYLAKYYKLKTQNIESIDIELQHVSTPEEYLLTSELQRNLSVAIKSLPTKAQLVYKLIKEDGFSYKQVAEILEISVNTVEGHMTTALKKITASLRNYLRSGTN
jgi:RNA polymerase sigma-70 factor (ECF subfamily)